MQQSCIPWILDFLLRRKSTFIFMENKSGVGLSLKITDKKPRYIFYENILWIFGFDKKGRNPIKNLNSTRCPAVQLKAHLWAFSYSKE